MLGLGAWRRGYFTEEASASGPFPKGRVGAWPGADAQATQRCLPRTLAQADTRSGGWLPGPTPRRAPVPSLGTAQATQRDAAQASGDASARPLTNVAKAKCGGQANLLFKDRALRTTLH